MLLRLMPATTDTEPSLAWSHRGDLEPKFERVDSKSGGLRASSRRLGGDDER